MRLRVDAEAQERLMAFSRGGIAPEIGAPALRRSESLSPLDHETRAGEREQVSLLGYLVLLLVVLGLARAVRTPVVEFDTGTHEGPARLQRAEVVSTNGAVHP